MSSTSMRAIAVLSNVIVAWIVASPTIVSVTVPIGYCWSSTVSVCRPVVRKLARVARPRAHSTFHADL
jgi:hypothetical protein